MKTTTKTFFAALALTAGLGAATLPASAQPLPPRVEARADVRIDSRIQSLRGDISLGQRSGRISRTEASRLNRKVDDVALLKRSYERSGRGLNGQEANALNAKIDTVATQIRVQARDNNRR